jgi:putative spermidine/putrescine transport system ATP-binding protein
VVEHRAGSIRIERVAKRYGAVHALTGVDLEVRRGEFLTLLGPSGSGKTTLLNLIAGFQQPDDGRIQVDGREVTHLPAHARGFGMVFQSYALFPHMTVAENVAYPLRMRGVARALREELVARYLSMVELEDLGQRYPPQLSGGQQQRVALARALVFEPPVLLMDEPLGALDRRLRQSLQFEIKRIHQELGATVLYVTHDQEEALAMSDRVAVMRDGRIEQSGAPRAVYEEPETTFVASFLGETNLLEVEVVAGNGAGSTVCHKASDQRFDLPFAVHGSQATVSIRPESLRLESPDMPAILWGRVASVAFMGDSWRCEILVGGDALVTRQAVHEGPPPGAGQEARISLLPGGARVIKAPHATHPSDEVAERWKEGSVHG